MPQNPGMRPWARRGRNRERPDGPRGTAVFIYSICCLTAFVVMAAIYARGDLSTLVGKYRILTIAWWGGVGGLVANLEVVARTGDRWRPKAASWYFGRPI